jgi:hypothetical protein
MLFKTAEGLCKTVDEVLLGRPMPMSNTEHRYWIAYLKVKRELQEEAAEANASQKDDSGEQRFVTMGQRI